MSSAEILDLGDTLPKLRLELFDLGHVVAMADHTYTPSIRILDHVTAEHSTHLTAGRLPVDVRCKLPHQVLAFNLAGRRQVEDRLINDSLEILGAHSSVADHCCGVFVWLVVPGGSDPVTKHNQRAEIAGQVSDQHTQHTTAGQAGRKERFHTAAQEGAGAAGQGAAAGGSAALPRL